MRIDFEDGSFIALMPSQDKITFVTCGRKSRRETTMSSSELTRENVEELLAFLTKWYNNKEADE